MRKFLPLIFLLFTSGLSPAELPATKFEIIDSLSLEKSVKSALKRKPSVHAYQQNIHDAKRQRKATLSTYLPNVSLSAKASSYKKKSFGVSYSQTVFNLAQRNYYKIYSANLSLAHHQKQSHEDTTRLSTETAFFNSWLLQQKLPLTILQYKSAKANFETSKNQNKNDLLNKNDWLKALATFDSEVATVNSFRDDIDEAEQTIFYYTGIELKLLPCGVVAKPTKLSWQPSERVVAKPLAYYYKIGMKNRKDLKGKQDSIDAESHKSQYYATKYLPSVSTYGSAEKYTLRSTNASYFSKEAGVQISWNVFDGLSNYFNKSAADARKLKTTFEKEDLREQIKLEIQTSYSSLQKEIKNLDAQTTSYKQAKNEFELKKQEYTAGLISKVELDTANYTYETARYSWLTQAAQTALQKQDLLYRCGYPA